MWPASFGASVFSLSRAARRHICRSADSSDHPAGARLSLQGATERVKEPGARSRRRVGVDLADAIKVLNLYVRRWGFHIGNASNRFRQLDRYVAGLLKRLLIKRRVVICVHRRCVTMLSRPLVCRVRENRTYGLKGDGQLGPRSGTRFLTINDHSHSSGR